MHRQILFLKEEHHLATIGFDAPKEQGVDFSPVANLPKKRSLVKRILNTFHLQIHQFERYYWSQPYVQSVVQHLQQHHFDLIIANDINTLPLALLLAKGNCKVLFDAHEYAPKEFADNWRWRIQYQRYNQYLCRQYLHQADAMITACDGYAEAYQLNYGIAARVITNAPFYIELQPQPVDNTRIRLFHHGTVNPSRQTEAMITLMDQLDNRFTLEMFLLSSDMSYMNSLRQLSAQQSRIHFHEPVPLDEIIHTGHQYDIGLYLLPPNNLLHRVTVPNKLLEFIQSRLAVAIWPSPGMAKVVREYDCGVITDDFTIESMAQTLNALSVEQIHYYKQQSHQAARLLSADHNRQVLLNLVERLLAN